MNEETEHEKIQNKQRLLLSNKLHCFRCRRHKWGCDSGLSGSCSSKPNLAFKIRAGTYLWTSLLCQNCKHICRQRNANPPIRPPFPFAVTEDSSCNSRKHGLLWVKKDCFLVTHELLMWCTTLPMALYSQSACLVCHVCLSAATYQLWGLGMDALST